MLKKHIVLIGMRGAGKSFYGEKISRALKIPFIDLDGLIQQDSKMTIQEMVAAYGWEYFRDQEYEIFKKSLNNNNCLIASGGGLPIFERNQNLLKNCCVIWIYTPIEILLKRLSQKSSHRPALTQGQSQEQEIKNIYREREPIYREYADYILNAKNPIDEEIESLIQYLHQMKIIIP